MFLLEPFRDLDDEGREAQVQCDASFLGLRILVKASSGLNGAQCLAEGGLARIYMAQNSNV